MVIRKIIVLLYGYLMKLCEDVLIYAAASLSFLFRFGAFLAA